MPHLPTLFPALGTRRGRRVPFFALARRLPPRALGLLSLGLLAGCLFAGQARAQSADQVKADFARAVYVHSATQVHNQRPQPLLRAVVVLRVRLDEQNRWKAEVFRDNPDQPEMTRAALESVARLPAPVGLSPKAVDMLRSEGLVEAWLFENDGRFALKTLAKPQRGA
jgi:protein TonB